MTVRGGGWLGRLRGAVRRRPTSPLGAPLAQKRLFLMPTRLGLGWAALVVVLLLFGVNFQNSLAHALACWLFALGVVVLLRAWRNLLGVRLELRLPSEVFAGGEARLAVIARARRERTALSVRCAGARAWLDVRGGRGEAELALPVAQRGPLPLPRLCLESRWPLGLVRAVAWLAHDAELLVWPRPLEDAAPPSRPDDGGLDSGDFAGLRRFTPGDGPARLAWKAWSRTGTLTTKVFECPSPRARWLDYAACPGDPEQRLSRLCGQVMALHRAGARYGLRLPGMTLPEGEGEGQRRAALEALARWQPPGAEAPRP